MAVNRVIFPVLLSFVGAALIAAPIELKVTGNRVNLRARPLADAEVAGQVSSGEILLAPDGIASDAEWVKVRPPRSVDLWIYAALVTDGAVNAADTYVRCGPGPQFKPVGKLQKGDRVERRGVASGDWMRIAPTETAELFISSQYVVPVEKEQAVETVPDVAATPLPDTDIEQAAAEKISARSQQRQDDIVAEQVSNDSASAEIPAGKPAAANAAEPTIAPSKPEPAVSVPQELSAYLLSPTSRQGDMVALSGRLEKLSMPICSGLVRFQLAERNGNYGSSAICRIIGLEGQWRELVGSDVEIKGRLWTLSGESVPIINAENAIRIASWEK